MKNVTLSSGKVLFIVLIVLVVAILLAAGAGFYFKKTAPSSKPDPQPVVTRHKMPPAPAQPETEMVAVNVQAPDSETSAPPAGDLKSDIAALAAAPQTVDATTQAAIPGDLDSDRSAPIITPVSDDERSVQTETGQAGDGADEGGDQPLVVPAPGTTTESQGIDSQASAADISKQPPGAEDTPLQTPATSSPPLDERPTAAAPEVSPSQETLFYSIQVGAYRSKDNASRKVAELLEKGYEAFIIETGAAKSQTLYAVRFGRFAGKPLARAPLAEFKEKEKKPAFIMRSDQ